MKKIITLFMTFILITGLTGCGRDDSETESSGREASEIKLPKEIDYITDMKVDENGYITLAAYERKGDYNGVISISKTKDDGESWETLYQREVSIKKKKITLLRHICTLEIQEFSLKWVTGTVKI